MLFASFLFVLAYTESGAILQSRIAAAISQRRVHAWTPLFCKEKGCIILDNGSVSWEVSLYC